MIKKSLWFFLFCACNLMAQSKGNDDVKIGTLRKQLTAHYQNDPQKQKAVAFLMDNIGIHFAQNYRWVDKSGKNIPFDELSYDNHQEAIVAFMKLKDSVKIKPQTYDLKDIDAVTPELLIKNIDLAFDAWRNNPWSKTYDFETFCEYILPYRGIIEPLEDWRSDLQTLVSFESFAETNKNSSVEIATNVILGLKNFTFLSSRPDPIAFLSAKQLLFRREGSCNDLANLAVLACRSVGLATTFDFTPHYGASSNRHFWNTIISEKGEYIPFNGNSYGTSDGLPYSYDATKKRLAKVFRRTFSIQQNTLATLTNENEIPEGCFRDKNIKDVTSSYVSVGKISYRSEIPNNLMKICYLNVFNTGAWKPIDWSKKNFDLFEFSNLGINIVYLPSYYDAVTTKMQFANYPILLQSTENQVVLQPNYSKTFSYDLTRDISIKGKTLDFNSFEVFDNEVFSLLVWDHGWKKLEEVTAANKIIHFSKIPDNGLFLVVCKKSNGYERIFRINAVTKQIEWY